MQAMWGGYDLQANHLLERSFATAVQAMISWPTSFLNDILIPHFGLWPSGKPCAWKNLCYHIPGYDSLTSHVIGRSSATAVQTMKWVIDMYKWEPNIQKRNVQVSVLNIQVSVLPVVLALMAGKLHNNQSSQWSMSCMWSQMALVTNVKKHVGQILNLFSTLNRK